MVGAQATQERTARAGNKREKRNMNNQEGGKGEGRRGRGRETAKENK